MLQKDTSEQPVLNATNSVFSSVGIYGVYWYYITRYEIFYHLYYIIQYNIDSNSTNIVLYRGVDMLNIAIFLVERG
jgi:hypothetical protein